MATSVNRASCWTALVVAMGFASANAQAQGPQGTSLPVALIGKKVARDLEFFGFNGNGDGYSRPTAGRSANLEQGLTGEIIKAAETKGVPIIPASKDLQALVEQASPRVWDPLNSALKKIDWSMLSTSPQHQILVIYIGDAGCSSNRGFDGKGELQVRSCELWGNSVLIDIPAKRVVKKMHFLETASRKRDMEPLLQDLIPKVAANLVKQLTKK